MINIIKTGKNEKDHSHELQQKKKQKNTRLSSKKCNQLWQLTLEKLLDLLKACSGFEC